MSQSDICMDILKMEYVQTTEKLHYLEDQANKYVSYVLTATGVFATLLTLLVDKGRVSNKLTFSLLLAAGVAIVGILMIMALHYSVQSFRLGGYVKYIESKINLQTNVNLLRWETTIAEKTVHKNIASYFIYIIMAVVFFLLLGVAGYAAVRFIWPQSWLVACFVIGVILLEVAACIIYLCQAATVHNKIYKRLNSQDSTTSSLCDSHNDEADAVEQNVSEVIC